MIRGGIYLVRPESPMGHVLGGSPVLWLGEGLGDTGAARLAVDPGSLTPARLWLARGREWRGPFRSWRAALAAPPWPDIPLKRLASAGRGKPLGAEIISHGWRYRLAYAGAEPPERWRG